MAASVKTEVAALRRDVFAPDSVEKIFLGWRPKILGAADASYARRHKGPYRFIQKSVTASVAALKSDQQQRSPKINFREIFRVVRFSTFATVSATFSSLTPPQGIISTRLKAVLPEPCGI
jgi:hypothetical protein